jgi:hemoglobin
MEDIQTKNDIENLINQFYGKVFVDSLIGPFFKNLDFEKHKPKMVQFWCFALLDEPGYSNNVTEKHMHMPLKKVHFDRWLNLFGETIDELFTGELADSAKQRAFTIAWTIGNKIEKSQTDSL